MIFFLHLCRKIDYQRRIDQSMLVLKTWAA